MPTREYLWVNCFVVTELDMEVVVPLQIATMNALTMLVHIVVMELVNIIIYLVMNNFILLVIKNTAD